jgi:hypothetical protein
MYESSWIYIKERYIVKPNIISSFCESRKPLYLKWLNRIYLYLTVRYLNGTSHLVLTLGGTDPIMLEWFADSSYVESGESESQLAYCMRLGKSYGMFLSKSIKNTHVSLSSEFLGVSVFGPTPFQP